ncbi:MAG: hypothetical protein ACLGQH_09000 [Acidobacteriota bacterium]
MTNKGFAAGILALAVLFATFGPAQAGNAPAATARTAGNTPPNQTPGFKNGLPTRIGSISIQKIFESSPRMHGILTALDQATSDEERDKVRLEQLQPQLNGLRDIVALYAKQNGYPIILERAFFEYYLQTGRISEESLGYCEERYTVPFIAMLRTPEGKAYAQQLKPVDLDNAIIQLFQ